MIIWNWLKGKKPVKISLKHRQEGDIMVVCSRDMTLSYLNKTGGFIFELSNGKNTLDNIVRLLLNRFNVEEDVLIADLVDIIRDMQFKRIIRLEA